MTFDHYVKMTHTKKKKACDIEEHSDFYRPLVADLQHCSRITGKLLPDVVNFRHLVFYNLGVVAEILIQKRNRMWNLVQYIVWMQITLFFFFFFISKEFKQYFTLLFKSFKLTGLLTLSSLLLWSRIIRKGVENCHVASEWSTREQTNGCNQSEVTWCVSNTRKQCSV